VIPDTVNNGTATLPVTSIADNAFLNKTSITSITIGENIKSVGISAFSGCTNVTALNWNAVSITTAFGTSGYYPFAYLGQGGIGVQITFGESVQMLPANFMYTTVSAAKPKVVGSIVIPDSVVTIGGRAFVNFTEVTSITIGKGLTSLGDTGSIGAFNNGSNVTSFTWNAINYTAAFDINTHPFAALGTATAGMTLTFGDSVQTIPDNFCYAASPGHIPKITGTVAIPDSVTKIGAHALYSTGISNIWMNGSDVPLISSDSFTGSLASSGGIVVPVGSLTNYSTGSANWSAHASKMVEAVNCTGADYVAGNWDLQWESTANFDYGTQHSVTVVPAAGFSVSSIDVTGAGALGTGWTVSGNTVTINNLVAPITISAETEEVITYTVTFKSQDGASTLYTNDFVYGAVVTYGGTTPVKTQTPQYTYTFAGWATIIDQTSGTAIGSLPTVSGVTTYYAAFSETLLSYTVTFVVPNDTVQNKTSTVAYGIVPSYGGTPVKASTQQYIYTFKGWNTTDTGDDGTVISLPAVTGTAVYYAIFSTSATTYTVTFKSQDGVSTLYTDTFAYGTAVTYGGTTPVKTQTPQYTYTFAGWATSIEQTSGTPVGSLPTVIGATTYYAAFSQSAIGYTITTIGLVEIKATDGKLVLDGIDAVLALHPNLTFEWSKKIGDGNFEDIATISNKETSIPFSQDEKHTVIYNCKVFLDGNEIGEHQYRVDPPKSDNIWIWILIGLVIVFTIMMIVFFLVRRKKSNAAN
jgi:hypothetical protein